MNPKIIYIPGWPYKIGLDGFNEGLDVWQKNISPDDKINADYIIGYSLGAIFALLVWQKNPECKLILVNPPLVKRSHLTWFFLWVKYLKKEKINIFKQQKYITHRYLSALIKGYKLFAIDALKIIDGINRENDLIIIRGQDDNYFCDEEAAKIIKNKKIQLIEIEGVGHKWDKKINGIINKLIV